MKTYQVPNVQKMMHRKDAKCIWVESLHSTHDVEFRILPRGQIVNIGARRVPSLFICKHKNVERAASASMGTILSWMKSFFSRAFGRICKWSLFLYIYIIYFTTLRFSECAYILAHIKDAFDRLHTEKKGRNKLKEKSSNTTGLPFEWHLPVPLQPYSKFCLCKIKAFILTPVALDSSVLYWSFPVLVFGDTRNIQLYPNFY